MGKGPGLCLRCIITHYEVVHIQKSIPDFKKRNMELLTFETDPEVLRAMEVFEVKIITYEHMQINIFINIFCLLHMFGNV